MIEKLKSDMIVRPSLLGRIPLGIPIILALLLLDDVQCCMKLHEIDHDAFRTRWNNSSKTIYDGDSVQELVDMCPSGCADCATFPVLGPDETAPPEPEACTKDDIEILQKAQLLVKGWMDAVKIGPLDLIIHGSMVGVILLLNVLLVLKGHYRIKDLWYVATENQWQLETDPTWGLPGKVWSLLKLRVVKSANKEPTQRKYLSYTVNPTVMGDPFWFYKHALRDMYKKHKYYKLNRFFHKLAWQMTKVGKIIPETLRRHRSLKRRAGEVEKIKQAPSPPPELDPLSRLPLAVDLPNELNTWYLRKAKDILNREVDREKAQKRFINGRFQPQYASTLHHHHHHHHSVKPNSRPSAIQQPPLTFDEMAKCAKEMDTDPNADYVMVNDIMKVNPTIKTRHQPGPVHHHHHSRKGGYY